LDDIQGESEKVTTRGVDSDGGAIDSSFRPFLIAHPVYSKRITVTFIFFFLSFTCRSPIPSRNRLYGADRVVPKEFRAPLPIKGSVNKSE
jgi:hypothetical protein